MNTSLPSRVLICCMISLPLLASCRSHGPNYLPTEPERVEMLSLMLPQEIKIQPFTQIKSFNEDNIPDGILVVLRPTDKFGNAKVAAGLFYFELWTYEDATNERKGQRLAYWDRTIGTAEEVKLYWTRAQMYEFQLAWTQGADMIAPGRKYILTATYRTPWDETIRDEYVFNFQLPSEVAGSPSAQAPTKR